ncbi:uncharacterized protein LOC142339619 isoform X2 [Convolutriloba macropyga]
MRGGQGEEDGETTATINDYQDPNTQGIDFYASFVSEAIKHMQLKQLDIALERLQSAQKLRPTDAKCRLLQARCYISQSKLKKALNVINEVLDDHPDNYEATEMRGEVLYHTGQFEQAIVQYQQAKTIRPTKKSLKDGIENCEQAMRNAIGEQRGGRQQQGFDLHEPDNSRDQRFFEDKDAGVVKDITERAKKGKDKGGTAGGAKGVSGEGGSSVSDGVDGGPGGKKKKANKAVLLGDFYRDYVFLQGLLERQIVTNKDTALGRRVAPIVEDALKYLDTRADFWQRQEPMYRRDQSGYYKVTDDSAKKEKDGIIANTDSKLQFRNAILKIHHFIEEGQDEEALDLAEETLQMVQDADDDEINPLEKVVFLGELFSICGQAQQKMGNNVAARDYFQKDKKLSFDHNVEDGKYRSLDNLTSNYIASKDFQKALDTLMQRMKLTEDKYRKNPGDPGVEADLAWLHHELARTYLQEKQMEKALEHSDACVQFAEACQEDAWIIQGNFVMGEVYFQMGNHMEKARGALETAQNAIKDIDDQEGEFDAIDRKITAYLAEIDKLVSVGTASKNPSRRLIKPQSSTRTPATSVAGSQQPQLLDDRSKSPSVVKTEMGPQALSVSSRGTSKGGRRGRRVNKSAPSYVSSGGTSSAMSSMCTGSSSRWRRSKKKPSTKSRSPVTRGRGRGKARKGRGGGGTTPRSMRSKRSKKTKSASGMSGSDFDTQISAPPSWYGSQDSRSYVTSRGGTKSVVSSHVTRQSGRTGPGTQASRSYVSSNAGTKSVVRSEMGGGSGRSGSGYDLRSKGSKVSLKKSTKSGGGSSAAEDVYMDDGVPADGEEVMEEEQIAEEEKLARNERMPTGMYASDDMEEAEHFESLDSKSPEEQEQPDDNYMDDYYYQKDDYEEEAADDQEAEYDYEGGQEYDKAHNVQNEEKGKGSKNMEETVDGVEEGDGAEMEAEEAEADQQDHLTAKSEKTRDNEELQSAEKSVNLSAKSREGSDDRNRTPSADDWRSNLTPDDVPENADEEDEEDRMRSINDVMYKFDNKDDKKVTVDPNAPGSTVVTSSHDQKSNVKVRSLRNTEREKLLKKSEAEGEQISEEPQGSQEPGTSRDLNDQDIPKESVGQTIGEQGSETKESDVVLEGSKRRDSDIDSLPAASKGQHSTPRDAFQIAKPNQTHSEVSGSLQEEEEEEKEEEGEQTQEPKEDPRSEFEDQEEEELQDPTLQEPTLQNERESNNLLYTQEMTRMQSEMRTSEGPEPSSADPGQKSEEFKSQEQLSEGGKTHEPQSESHVRSDKKTESEIEEDKDLNGDQIAVSVSAEDEDWQTRSIVFSSSDDNSSKRRRKARKGK